MYKIFLQDSKLVQLQLSCEKTTFFISIWRINYSDRVFVILGGNYILSISIYIPLI